MMQALFHTFVFIYRIGFASCEEWQEEGPISKNVEINISDMKY